MGVLNVLISQRHMPAALAVSVQSTVCGVIGQTGKAALQAVEKLQRRESELKRSRPMSSEPALATLKRQLTVVWPPAPSTAP